MSEARVRSWDLTLTLTLTPLRRATHMITATACIGGRFGVAVTAFVTSTKLSHVESGYSTGIGDHIWRVYHPSIYPCRSGPLSLAIFPWAGAMSTGDGCGHFWEAAAPLKLRHFGAL